MKCFNIIAHCAIERFDIYSIFYTLKSTKINFDNRLQQTQLVATSSRGTVFSANYASTSNNILSGHVAKSREIFVTVVNNSKEMKDNQFKKGETPFDQDHESNYDTNVGFSYIVSAHDVLF